MTWYCSPHACTCMDMFPTCMHMYGHVPHMHAHAWTCSPHACTCMDMFPTCMHMHGHVPHMHAHAWTCSPHACTYMDMFPTCTCTDMFPTCTHMFPTCTHMFVLQEACLSLVKLVQGTATSNTHFLTSLSEESSEDDCDDALAIVQLVLVSHTHSTLSHTSSFRSTTPL